MKKLASAVAICLAVLAPAVAFAGKKPMKPAPVDITFQNTCVGDLALKLGVADVKVAAGQTALLTVSPESPGEALALNTTDATPVELARLTFVGGGKWDVKLASCAEGKADVLAKQTIDPNQGSPLAAAEVRFRARVRGFLEYQAGDMGDFKVLSVAMTSSVPARAGDYTLQLRKRGGSAKGPVLANLKKVVPILPGRKQVVEVDFGGAVPFVSVEDEGPLK